jgi:predicted GNAT family acetyltransferase
MVYELVLQGQLIKAAVTAVVEWEDKVFYFCGSYTLPWLRGKGYGEALMGLRVKYAVEQGAKKLVVYSLKPKWYLEHGWVQTGTRPSGALILEHTDPRALLDVMTAKQGEG